MERFETIDSFKEYEKLAVVTCKYPMEAVPVCIVLGLCGETGEFYEKIYEAGAVENVGDEDVLKEMGDVLWYMALVRHTFNLPEIEGWGTADGTTDDSMLPIVCAGKIAEQVKKYLRDDWNRELPMVMPEARMETIALWWKKMLGSMHFLAVKGFNAEIGKVAAQNINKLYDRMERGTLQGSGDNR